MTKEEAIKKLKEYGQEHVLRYFDELDPAGQEKLLNQIEETDLSVLKHIKDVETGLTRGEFAPLPVMQRAEIIEREKEFHDEGVRIIKEGKTAALLLAGGMGTRLGSDNPKGMYDIGLNKPVYIFQRIIENLLDVVKETDTWIHLFIMTSEVNHEKTVNFLKEKDYFGYREDRITFFKQSMAPACDYSGKLYMEERGKLFTSPNGNGGWYSSMERAGLDKVLKDEGIEWIDLFAVDNILQRICDPCFVGATAISKASVGAKVVKKAAPDEKIGVMCLEDGKPSIVEYYDLSEEMMDAKDDKGEPAYNFGVILNYLFHVPELNEVSEDKMPLHVVEKKINYMDESGQTVKPEKPNGYKFEQLVLDMIHQMDSCLPYEVIREHEFAPIKNATGIDSVESARELALKNGIDL